MQLGMPVAALALPIPVSPLGSSTPLRSDMSMHAWVRTHILGAPHLASGIPAPLLGLPEGTSMTITAHPVDSARAESGIIRAPARGSVILCPAQPRPLGGRRSPLASILCHPAWSHSLGGSITPAFHARVQLSTPASSWAHPG